MTFEEQRSLELFEQELIIALDDRTAAVVARAVYLFIDRMLQERGVRRPA